MPIEHGRISTPAFSPLSLVLSLALANAPQGGACAIRDTPCRILMAAHTLARSRCFFSQAMYTFTQLPAQMRRHTRRASASYYFNPTTRVIISCPIRTSIQFVSKGLGPGRQRISQKRILRRPLSRSHHSRLLFSPPNKEACRQLEKKRAQSVRKGTVRCGEYASRSKLLSVCSCFERLGDSRLHGRMQRPPSSHTAR
jgi:hypothetical protein